MPRAQTVQRDTLGILTAGSILVSLAQGQADADRKKAHRGLMGWYQRLAQKYGAVCREYAALRRVNEDLQKQVREYERITDDQRVRIGELERREAQSGGN